MLAGLERTQDKIAMRVVARPDQHRLDLWIAQDRVDIGRGEAGAPLPRGFRRRMPVARRDRLQTELLRRGGYDRQQRAADEAARPDDGETQRAVAIAAADRGIDPSGRCLGTR